MRFLAKHRARLFGKLAVPRHRKRAVAWAVRYVIVRQPQRLPRVILKLIAHPHRSVRHLHRRNVQALHRSRLKQPRAMYHLDFFLQREQAKHHINFALQFNSCSCHLS